MFQFPGFALKTLCIQVKSTWFCSLLRTQALNNKQSSGFPHSEIHGSKLILSSPWLIAEYHVFHRLLLPRHPPNALLALDLIQKETDLRLSDGAGSTRRSVSGQKHTFPHYSQSSALIRSVDRIWLVYLTWTTLLVSAPQTPGSLRKGAPNAR